MNMANIYDNVTISHKVKHNINKIISACNTTHAVAIWIFYLLVNVYS